MQKIGNITTTATPEGEFTNGVVAGGIVPTNLDAAWFNTVQRELVNAVEGAELTLDPNNDGQLLAAIKSIVGAFAAPIGKIELMSFRSTELPAGWYHANGDQYATSSAVGQALLSLSAGYKEDWGITESGGMINVPNMYHTDGRAYFPRTGETPGVVQEDAIRNITGSFNTYGNYASTATGVFDQALGTRYQISGTAGGQSNNIISMDASKVVPTAEENRPLNISFVPAIYLGV